MTQYDLNSAEFLRDPYPVYDQLRFHDPIFWSAENDYWILTRYADIASLIQNDRLSSNRIGAHAFAIQSRDLAMAGKYRLKARDAHLHRLLDHVVQPRRFEGREKVMQIGWNGLRAGLATDPQHRDPLGERKTSAPFAVSSVESKNMTSRFETENRT